jgi:hypothetical protein
VGQNCTRAWSERSSSAWVHSSESTEDEGKRIEESEFAVLPMKPGKSLQATQWREGRTYNIDPMEGQMAETSSSSPISTKLQRIATLAKELRGRELTTLAHHIDVPFLQEAYRRTRKDGAVGVDGQTAEA